MLISNGLSLVALESRLVFHISSEPKALLVNTFLSAILHCFDPKKVSLRTQTQKVKLVMCEVCLAFSMQKNNFTTSNLKFYLKTQITSNFNGNFSETAKQK